MIGAPLRRSAVCWKARAGRWSSPRGYRPHRGARRRKTTCRHISECCAGIARWPGRYAACGRRSCACRRCITATRRDSSHIRSPSHPRTVSRRRPQPLVRAASRQCSARLPASAGERRDRTALSRGHRGRRRATRDCRVHRPWAEDSRGLSLPRMPPSSSAGSA